MKSLNTYINEGLADWGDDKSINKKLSKQTSKTAVKNEIIEWIQSNTMYRIYKNKLKFNFDTSPITVDYEGDVGIKYGSDSLTNGIFQWGKIDGKFNCNFTKIKSLEGAPRETYTFNCTYCDLLKTLEGAPNKCKYFSCSDCKSLTSLEGAPEDCEFFTCIMC